MFGREGIGFDVVGPRFAAAFRRAHAPASGHWCAVSERWSKQYFLDHVLVVAALIAVGIGDVPHPLQLSHLNGRKSSWWQKAIWQCAPIASTSPTDILLNDDSSSSLGSGVRDEAAILQYVPSALYVQ